MFRMTTNDKKSSLDISNDSNYKSMYDIQDLYRIIQVQQSTINKLNTEVFKCFKYSIIRLLNNNVYNKD